MKHCLGLLKDISCVSLPFISVLPLFTWFANNVELPLANLTGHGDVKMHTLEEVRGYCKKANLKVIKPHKAIKFGEVSVFFRFVLVVEM